VRILEITVVEGKATPPATYAAFQARVCAVPLSLIRITRFVAFVGEPLGAPKVAPATCAVRE